MNNRRRSFPFTTVSLSRASVASQLRKRPEIIGFAPVPQLPQPYRGTGGAARFLRRRKQLGQPESLSRKAVNCHGRESGAGTMTNPNVGMANKSLDSTSPKPQDSVVLGMQTFDYCDLGSLPAPPKLNFLRLMSEVERTGWVPDPTPVKIVGEALSKPVFWIGEQWAVTSYGIEARDGTYAADREFVFEIAGGAYDFCQHVGSKSWVNRLDLACAFRAALMQFKRLSVAAYRRKLCREGFTKLVE